MDGLAKFDPQLQSAGADPTPPRGESDTKTKPPKSAADRNLLFGILALQLDFVSRDELIAAMNSWALTKHKLLGEILVEQEVLAPSRRDLLEQLVQEHLRKHKQDVQQSLLAIAPSPALAREFKGVEDEEVRQMLSCVVIQSEERMALSTMMVGVGNSTSQGTRFQVLRPHAEGGLGRVFVARDEELKREVALKDIKPQFATQEGYRSRFLLEAEVTGLLEHPGVVPVYGLNGAFPDGRPYYAMRFINSENLKHAIDRFHSSEELRKDPGRRNLELRNLLGQLVHVCDTLSYAHSRGVIHRDLKPENIMIGQFGETLVVDWGLAKVKHRKDLAANIDAEHLLNPSSGSDVAATQMGSAIGTPRYMSPEQAVGRLDEIAVESDVYGLGATLYHLLTGKTAFETADVGEVLRKVQRGEFPRPRQIDRSVPVPLEAICLKAMALRPSDRYPTTKELARDLQRWLADEPVSCVKEALLPRLLRMARRHRGWTAGISIGLIALAITSTVSAVIIGHARDREAAARQKANEEATTSTKVSDFLVNLFRSSNPLGMVASGDTGFGRLEEGSANLTARQLLDRGAERVRAELKGQPEVAARLLSTIGSVYGDLGFYHESAKLLAESLNLKLKTLPADDPTIAVAKSEVAWAHYERGDYHESQRLFREALAVQQTLPDEENKLNLTTTMVRLGLVLSDFGQFEEAESLIQKAIQMRRELLGEDAQGVAIALGYEVALGVKQTDDSKVRRAVAQMWMIHAKHSGDPRPGEAMGRFSRSLTAVDRGDYTAAEADLRVSIELGRQVLGESHPFIAGAMGQHAACLIRLKKLTEAEQELTEARRIALRFLKPDHLYVRLIAIQLAVLYFRSDRYPEAEKILRENLEIVEKSPLSNPYVRSRSELTLGEFLSARGRNDEAEPLLRAGVERIKTSPGMSISVLGEAYTELGNCLLRKNQLDDAIATLRAAFNTEQACQPRNESKIALNGARLGDALLRSGDLAGAEEYLRTANTYFWKESKVESEQMRTASLLGRCYFLQGKLPEAEKLLLQVYQLAIEIDAFDADSWFDVACVGWGPDIRTWLVDLYEKQGKQEEAAKYQVPIEEIPKS